MKRQLARLVKISSEVMKRNAVTCYSCIRGDGPCRVHQEFSDAIRQARKALRDERIRNREELGRRLS